MVSHPLFLGSPKCEMVLLETLQDLRMLLQPKEHNMIIYINLKDHMAQYSAFNNYSWLKPGESLKNMTSTNLVASCILSQFPAQRLCEVKKVAL